MENLSDLLTMLAFALIWGANQAIFIGVAISRRRHREPPPRAPWLIGGRAWLLSAAIGTVAMLVAIPILALSTQLTRTLACGFIAVISLQLLTAVAVSCIDHAQ